MPASAAAPEIAPDGWERLDPTPLLRLWHDHYGVAPAAFAELVFWRRAASDSLWALNAAATPPPLPCPETLGLRVRRGDKPDTQVSNAFARRYFTGATRHVVRVADDAGVLAYFAGDLAASPGDGDGYYLVLGPAGVLGRARVHRGVLRAEPSRKERTAPVL